MFSPGLVAAVRKLDPVQRGCQRAGTECLSSARVVLAALQAPREGGCLTAAHSPSAAAGGCCRIRIYACGRVGARTSVLCASLAAAAVGLTRARLSRVFELAKGYRGKAKNAFRVAHQQVMGALQNQVCSLPPCVGQHREHAHVEILGLERWMLPDPPRLPLLDRTSAPHPGETPNAVSRRILSMRACLTSGGGTVLGPEGAEEGDAVAVDRAHQRGRARARAQVRRLHPRHGARQHGGATLGCHGLFLGSRGATIPTSPARCLRRRRGPGCERWTKACSLGTLRGVCANLGSSALTSHPLHSG